MQLPFASLGFAVCLSQIVAPTGAASAERMCIDAPLPDRFTVSVEGDGVTWRLESRARKLLGKVQLTCRVDSKSAGGVAIPLGMSEKICLGANVPNLQAGGAPCIVQKIQTASMLPGWGSEDELPGFLPSELDAKLVESRHWFWIVGRFVGGSYTRSAGRQQEILITDKQRNVRVTSDFLPPLQLMMLDDGSCVVAMGWLESGDLFSAAFMDVIGEMNAAPYIVEKLQQQLRCKQ